LTSATAISAPRRYGFLTSKVDSGEDVKRPILTGSPLWAEDEKRKEKKERMKNLMRTRKIFFLVPDRRKALMSVSKRLPSD
jgi:hypothetical protein